MSVAPPQPAWELIYRGVNITNDVSEDFISITYTDTLEHATSQLEIEIQDREKRWQGPWFPERGDVMELHFGYAGRLVPAGLFQVDTTRLKGPADVVVVHGLSAAITSDMRTHFSKHYEGVSLGDIAETIAQRHGLTVVSAPTAFDVTLRRATQKHETNLQFLRRIANLYGYAFTIKGDQLVFFSRTALESQAPVGAIRRSDGNVKEYNFETIAGDVYRTASVSHFDVQEKALLSAEAQDPGAPTGDDLSLPIRAEDSQDAQAKANAALHGNNMYQTTATITVVGDPSLMAGLTVTTVGWGEFDLQWLIDQATHKLTRTGAYTTEVHLHVTGTGEQDFPPDESFAQQQALLDAEQQDPGAP